MSFFNFIEMLTSNFALSITVILTLAVVLVNGWTDAPNAIATCVATKSISPRKAIIMAAVFNFLGVIFMCLLSNKIVYTISGMVNFGGNSHDALIALCSAMLGIVIWATLAWIFGIPTSESHALIAGLSGAAIALQGGLSGINGSEWIKVIYGLVLSTFLGFILGYIFSKLIVLLFRKANKRKSQIFFQYAQITGGAAMAFMHGAQDGLKFIGVFMLGTFLAQGQFIPSAFEIPIWLMVLCSSVMGLGTSIGGYRIIKTVGMDMVKLEKYQGFAADMSASLCLFVSTFFGIPVSTTHTKTTSMMGVAAAKRISSVKWNIVKDMLITWVLTFPGCGLIGFLIAKLFIVIF